jgi:hypothetical protein
MKFHTPRFFSGAIALILQLNTSSIRKKKRDNGPPCMTPQGGMDAEEGDPFMRIKKKPLEIKEIIQFIHLSENPKVKMM